jgi:hypothetical protein
MIRKWVLHQRNLKMVAISLSHKIFTTINEDLGASGPNITLSDLALKTMADHWHTTTTVPSPEAVVCV